MSGSLLPRQKAAELLSAEWSLFCRETIFAGVSCGLRDRKRSGEATEGLFPFTSARGQGRAAATGELSSNARA